MPFTTHKITRFARKISDLPDDPQIPASELKARFDACPEELREAHNAVCDEAERLEARVSGIVAQTFGGAVAKTMLAPELAAEIDAKAAQTALDAEAAARESTDERVTAVEAALPVKCEVVFGVYTGNASQNRTVSLGFRPKAVLVLKDGTTAVSGNGVYGGLALDGFPAALYSTNALWVTDTGFAVLNSGNVALNLNNSVYNYLALK